MKWYLFVILAMGVVILLLTALFYLRKKRIADLRAQGAGRLVFVIGGSLGLGKNILERADEELSMSPMTFPHQLARVMLLEQLYRCEKILAGERYHK